MDDSIFIQYWMVLIITLWMFFVWNKYHPIVDGSYLHIMDVFCMGQISSNIGSFLIKPHRIQRIEFNYPIMLEMDASHIRELTLISL